MVQVSLLWENEEERELVQRLQMDWYLYGEIHITNAPRGHGLTRLDPTGIKYMPPSSPQPDGRGAHPLVGVLRADVRGGPAPPSCEDPMTRCTLRRVRPAR